MFGQSKSHKSRGVREITIFLCPVPTLIRGRQSVNVAVTRTAVLLEKCAVPRKIRELVADLVAAGFEDRGGKGSHRNFIHPNVRKPVTLSGRAGDDAKMYQERAVKRAIEESKS